MHTPREQGRHSHADAWNTEAKLICSYASQKNAYTVNEGNPIVNDQWIAPQNRLGLLNDTNLPTDMELNVFARDGITESLLSSKETAHRPSIFSLPKNTSLQSVDRLQPVQVPAPPRPRNGPAMSMGLL